MKKDLVTAIIAAILGVVITYIVAGFFIPEIKSVEFKVLDSDMNYSIIEPNPEIFNYRAINPTVEVYVGQQCEVRNEAGECVDGLEENQDNKDTTPEENRENIPETPPEEQPSGEENENGTTN